MKYALIVLFCLFAPFNSVHGEEEKAEKSPKTYQAHLSDREHHAGFFDLYLDHDEAAIYASLPAPEADGISLRFIYSTGLTAGLGSNPIGLDRGAASSGVIIRLRKIGNRVVAEQENWTYRATADRPEEKRAVEQSFASSFLWSTDIKATSADGKLLIDLSGFLTRDQSDLATALKHGKDNDAYKLAKERSFPDVSSALVFPDNVEIDAYLTFETTKPNAQTAATAADGRAVTLVQHHSFVRLPDSGYAPRKFDQRTANIGMGYYDYSNPLDASIVSRQSRRFRLEKIHPDQASSPVKKPIIYYVDSGAPEQIRQALVEGANWWATGFEAAGFQDAYRVEVLPDGVHPLDVRYNVINWVHRQTRGWSYGGSVSDPRTGEILKANVILGSQRVRQDRMIFEGLAGAEHSGTGQANDPVEISLARIRQLSAHEVGHTLGFAHNFAASANDRASVMDYPAPFVRPTPDGKLDFSEAYAVGLGDWDIFTVKWLYGQFPETTDTDAALDQLVSEAYGSGLRFISDNHARSSDTAHPYAAVWDNGNDPVATLEETLRVRRIALENFDLKALQDNRPTSDLNAVIVPIYLYHRYQLAAAAKSIGGLDFRYRVKGDGANAAQPVPPAQQRRALETVLTTLAPSQLDLPDHILNNLTPGDVGYAAVPESAELFPSTTGPVFDLLSAADIAADLTLSTLLSPGRINRLVAFDQRDEDYLSLNEMLDRIETTVFSDAPSVRTVPIARVIQSRLISNMIARSRQETTSAHISAIIDGKLISMRDRFTKKRRGQSKSDRQHLQALAARIDRHLNGIAVEQTLAHPAPQIPPGSPIGGATNEACWHCTSLLPQ